MKRSNKKRSTIYFVIAIIITVLVGYIGSMGVTVGSGAHQYRVHSFLEKINKGLDLVGGVSVVEQVQGKNVDAATINRTIELLNLRMNKMGVSETSVTREGKDKIRIEVPGKFDSDEVVNTIGKTGELKFVGPDKKTILTGKDVKDATANFTKDTSQPVIELTLNAEGTKKFAKATKEFLGKKISVYMDDDLITDPTVNAVITDGKSIIEGSKTIEEASKQAKIIKSGALPVTLKAVQVKTVGSTLGKTALPDSIKAGAIGIALVFLFMILYYRLPGIMADIALVLYVILVLAVFVSIKATLTLSGIAGFLLTVGMAVDANVLIFERIKEELKMGKSVKSAMDAGFNKALSSILDSNITTIIAGIVLYMAGSGAVKGFALTLMIGIVISIFTALTITKHLLKWSIEMGLIRKLSHFGVKGEQ